MNNSDQMKKDLRADRSFQKGLLIFNAILGLLLVVIILLAGYTWFSDRAMTSLVNHIIGPRLNRLIQNNPEILTELRQSFSNESMTLAVNNLLENDPRILAEFAAGLEPELMSRAVNITLQEQADFLSNFVGTLNTASLEAIIDHIAKNHTEFMTDLVDIIIELIRKDFMKSGI